jgi:hypothetical protein
MMYFNCMDAMFRNHVGTLEGGIVSENSIMFTIVIMAHEGGRK